MVTILQANINNSRLAYGLLEQTMLERQAGVAIISEPNKRAKHNNGLGSLNERVATMWVPQNCQASCMPRARTEDTATVKLGDVLISGLYFDLRLRYVHSKGSSTT